MSLSNSGVGGSHEHSLSLRDHEVMDASISASLFSCEKLPQVLVHQLCQEWSEGSLQCERYNIATVAKEPTMCDKTSSTQNSYYSNGY